MKRYCLEGSRQNQRRQSKQPIIPRSFLSATICNIFDSQHVLILCLQHAVIWNLAMISSADWHNEQQHEEPNATFITVRRTRGPQSQVRARHLWQSKYVAAVVQSGRRRSLGGLPVAADWQMGEMVNRVWRIPAVRWMKVWARSSRTHLDAGH